MGLRDEILAELVPEMSLDLADATEAYSFERSIGGGWDAVNNKPIAGTVTAFNGQGIYTSFSLYEQQQSEILHGDVKFIIPSIYERPFVGEVLTVKDDKYNIINEFNSPANVIYTLQLRRVGA